MKAAIILMTLTIFSSTALAVSFDCRKASTFVEHEICRDPLLGRLDDALSINYINMRDSDFGGTTKALKADQLKWLSLRNKCTNKQCLVRLYRQRIDETCDYGVVSGVHPDCVSSEDIN